MATEDKKASEQVNITTEEEEQEEDVELSDEYDSNDEYENMSCYQEDAMFADKYEDEGDGPYKTHEQKLERLLYLANKVENKEYCPKTLREVYPDVEVVTPSELNNRVQIANAYVNEIADKQQE